MEKPGLKSVLTGTDGYALPRDDKIFFTEMGQRIAERRRALGITQTQLAAELECSQQIVAHYENGSRRVLASVVPQLATALDCSVEELMGLNQKRSRRAPQSAMHRKLERIKQLPRSQQQAIMAMIDGILREHAA